MSGGGTVDHQPEQTEDEGAEIRAVEDALQLFANFLAEESVLVTGGLVVWEQTRFNDEGQLSRRLQYAVLGDGTSMGESLGLAVAGQRMLEHDLFAGRDEDEDDD